MEAYFIYIAIVVILALVLWFVISKVYKNKKPKEVTAKDLPISVDDLMKCVGGKDNIKETTASGSKMTFFLYDDSMIDIDGLKDLKASGMIQSTGKLTVIMGKFSKELSDMINQRQ